MPTESQFANFGFYPQIEDRKNHNMSGKLHGPRVHLAQKLKSGYNVRERKSSFKFFGKISIYTIKNLPVFSKEC